MRRSTLILLLVFGLLVVFAWLFQRYQTDKTSTSSTATPIPPAVQVYNLTNPLVSGLSVADNTGNKVDMYREASTDNQWAIKDMPVGAADNVGIETAISQLLSIKVIDVVTETIPLESIGLDTPVYTVTMQTTDGRQIVTDVGILTPIGTGYYVRVDSGPIIIVDNLTLDTILKYVKKPPLLITPTPATSIKGTPLAPDILVTPTP